MNNCFLLKRKFEEDYSLIGKKTIDMTLSGSFLSKRNIVISKKCLQYLISHYPLVKFETKLKENLISFYNIKNNNIILGNGCNGIIQNLFRILFINGGNLITTFYTFEQAEYLVNSIGGKTISIKHNDDFFVNFDFIKKNINKDTKAVYLCNPNNFTGLYENIEKIIDLSYYARNIPIIIDESSMLLSGKKSLLELKTLPDNLIILNSLSKTFGLSGLRVGFGVFPDKYYTKYKNNTTINEISNLSLYIANKCFNNKIINNNIEKINIERNFLFTSLNNLNFNIINSCTNVLMTKDIFSNNFFNKLNKNNISIIKVKDYLGNYRFRIAVQNHITNSKFINKIKEIYNEIVNCYEF